jgi:hypothetical protein
MYTVSQTHQKALLLLLTGKPRDQTICNTLPMVQTCPQATCHSL